MVSASAFVNGEEQRIDVYGQVHPEETDDLISKCLRDFDDAVNIIPDKKKRCVMEAEKQCPDLLTSSFKLMFLRCEVFQVDVSSWPRGCEIDFSVFLWLTRTELYHEATAASDATLCYLASFFLMFQSQQLAAKRYAKYWDKRVDIFGPAKAFQPLTLAAALRDDKIPLELGSMQIIRRKTARDILHFDPSKLDKTAYSRESGCRALWYFFHALLEGDEDVQKRGIIILNNNANFSPKNRDPPFTKMCFATIKGALPIRLSAIHGCHVPLIYNCVAAIVMLFMGDRLRKRILTHNGSNEHVVDILQNKYGIDAEHIPQDMGGELQLDVRVWLEERAAAGF